MTIFNVLRNALFFVPALVLAFSGVHSAGPEPFAGSSAIPAVAAQDTTAGWIPLFDGKSFSGWRGLGLDRVPEKHWIIEDGAIKKVPSKDIPPGPDGKDVPGGDLMTIEVFGNFELEFDWKISPGGNSGVKYNVSEEMSGGNKGSRAALGFEYQVLDDDLHPDAKNGPHRTAASLYDLIAPGNKTLRPVGQYNSAKIVFAGNHGEHWLNGAKVLAYDLGTPAMAGFLEKSKFKSIASFADKRKGHIVLQDHTDGVWFKNIRIRILK